MNASKEDLLNLSAAQLERNSRLPGQQNVGSLSPNPFSRTQARLLTLILIYLLALAIRIPGLRTAEPNPDEEHWVIRSAQVQERLAAGQYREATTHLGHPGIPPSLVMMGSQFLAQSFNQSLNQKPGDRFYFDNLSASRLGALLVSALVFPLMFFLGVAVFGNTVATLATALLIFDCQHIALSRLAHLDAILTLLVTATVSSYIYAELKGSFAWKALSAIFWGLSIATKPTAAAVVGIFLVYKLLRATIVHRQLSKVISWSDLWAVLIGHCVLGVLYTKLWDPGNTYLTKHRIDPAAVQYISHLSELFLSNPAYYALFSALLILSSLVLIQARKFSKLTLNLAMTSLLTSAILLAIIHFPTVSGNMFRFWGWVVGLSNRNHEAYGKIWSPPGNGYSELWFRRISDTGLIGVVMFLPALYIFAKSAFPLGSSTNLAFPSPANAVRIVKEKLCLLLLLPLIPVIWSAPLSVSAKQTIRYVAPSFPFVMVMASFGYVWIASFFCKRFAFVSPKLDVNSAPNPALSLISGIESRRTLLLLSLLLLVPVTLQFSEYLAHNPYFSLYFNRASGGIESAVARGFSLGPVGYNQALKFVQDEAIRTDAKQRLEIIGDYDLMRYSYNRLYPAKSSRYVELSSYKGMIGSEWLLVFPYLQSRFKFPMDRSRLTPVVSLGEAEHTSVFTLYKIAPPSYLKPTEIPLQNGRWSSGKAVYGPRGILTGIAADPSFAKNGYLLFDLFAMVGPGSYQIEYEIAPFRLADDLGHPALPQHQLNSALEEQPTSPLSTPLSTPRSTGEASEDEPNDILRFKFGPNCSHSIPTRTWTSSPLKSVVQCSTASDARWQISAYWTGSTPIILKALTISKVHESSSAVMLPTQIPAQIPTQIPILAVPTLKQLDTSSSSN